jgi:hypothetical protein
MDTERAIAVSPRHTVRMANDYAALVDKAPRSDIVVRTLAKREVGDLPLMSGDLVVAGEDTRARHALAKVYPLHFRKTYFPGRLQGDPKVEYEQHARASEVIGVPPPIGWEPRVFRSCLIPGFPYARLSPFGTDPETSNIGPAQKMPLATAAGLLRLLEDAFTQIEALHTAGLSHGDTELHNFIVCPAPLELVLIDFEASVSEADFDAAGWEKRKGLDFEPLLKEVTYLSCALGRQSSRLAELAWERMDKLFERPERFRLAIEEQAAPNPR